MFAVDALTGEPTAFDADSGVDLLHAMSATCALPPLFPPISIGAGRWMDGGVRSTTNADLVDDCARVVVLAPIPKRGSEPERADPGRDPRLACARVALLTPDRAARRAFGRNALDASRIPGAAREGRRQGAATRDASGRSGRAERGSAGRRPEGPEGPGEPRNQPRRGSDRPDTSSTKGWTR